MSRSPSVCPLLASSSSLLMPCLAASSHRSGLDPNILKILRTSILLMSGSFLLTTPELLRNTIEHNGNNYNTQAGQYRSEERRVGKEGARTVRTRWSPDH